MQGRSSTPTTALRGGTVLAGEALGPIPNACVLVADGLITELAPAGEVSVPSGAEVIDMGGLTVLPGFIDAHVHIGFYPPRSLLLGGVTSARDLGWPPEQIFPLVRASREPAWQGPLLLAAGAMLTAPGGYPTRAGWAPAGTGMEIEGPEQARAAVAGMVQSGAAVIKVALNPAVGPSLDPVTLQAIVSAAHDAGRRVTGHTHGSAELDKALAAGVDELAHMLMGTELIPEETIEEMVRAGMVVVPTLAIRAGKELEVALSNLAAFVRAGGRVVYGTDLGNAGPVPGIDPTELALMSAAGMSPRAIVKAATSGAASWLGLERTGVLEPGRAADVIAVPADPLAEVQNLPAPRMVFRAGRRVL